MVLGLDLDLDLDLAWGWQNFGRTIVGSDSFGTVRRWTRGCFHW